MLVSHVAAHYARLVVCGLCVLKVLVFASLKTGFPLLLDLCKAPGSIRKYRKALRSFLVIEVCVEVLVFRDHNCQLPSPAS